MSIGTNISGDSKATELYLAHSPVGRAVLVVAVRGSASLVDWIVNSNTQDANASDFVVSDLGLADTATIMLKRVRILAYSLV